MSTTSGNAYDDGAERRGWLVGHFIEPVSNPLHSEDVEIKWATHPAGDERHEWTDAATEVRTTMVMLLRGQFTVRLPNGDEHMKREGDYVVFAPGTSHSWAAVEDSVVLTVRWPSIA
jgi:quercetin dioxygenase-like cupin family protein